MKRFEYRIGRIDLNAYAPREQQIVDALNAFGAEGWRLSGELNKSAIEVSPVRVLLEREGSDDVFRRLMMPGA
jgi:hypothetical protein